MPLFTLGINHNTAPVEIREMLSFGAEETARVLTDLADENVVGEAAMLSTCNRTELYCALADDRDATAIVDWLLRERGADPDAVRPCLYTHDEPETIRHLMRVTCGLDSMVLGEPQILGQVKDAYQTAVDAGTAGPLLHRLFQRSFAVAKQVRTDTSIGASPVSVAFAAVSLARQIFADFQRHTALLVGAGDTIELAAEHLHQRRLGRMIVANRNVDRAHALAGRFDGYAIGLDEIGAHLAEADIVISSTGAMKPIITADMVKAAFRNRRRRPVFMVDIAVPRDIETEVGRSPDVYLYSIDDLQAVIEDNLRNRREAAGEAESIVAAETAAFREELLGLDAVPTIRELREYGDRLRVETLERARRMLQAGHEPEEALDYLAHTLTNRLLHRPTAQLRRSDLDALTDLIRETRRLFGLDGDE